MAEKNLTRTDEIVKKSNAIARAKWSPKSVWESRIIALVASKVRQDDEDFKTFKIPVTELVGVSDDKLSGYEYNQIANSIRHLKKATIEIQGEKPNNFRGYCIFSMCGYENGNLVARFDSDLKPHYLELQRHFAQFNLTEFLSLPSTYSQQIFEILKSWDETPETTIPLADLHVMLDVPESLKANFKDFRRRVLEKAHKDITAKTSLVYDWEPIKKGRTVVSVRFIFSKPRIKKKKIEDKQIEKSEKQKRNNKIALAALSCQVKKGGGCKEDLGKDECGFCRSSLQV